jgi:hypothetical protein
LNNQICFGTFFGISSRRKQIFTFSFFNSLLLPIFTVLNSFQ